MTYNSIIKGYEKFYHYYFAGDDDLFAKLSVVGQSPKTLIIACCDSRVDPSIITQAKPGELFVIRNIANLVPPCEKDGGLHGISAAVEFAVRVLEVEHIIVMGHSQCAGIDALTNKKLLDFDFIQPWVELGVTAKKQAIDKLKKMHKESDGKILLYDKDNNLLPQHMPMVEKAMINMSVDNLLSFKWVKEKFLAKKIFVHGWYFEVKSGKLYICDYPDKEFRLHIK